MVSPSVRRGIAVLMTVAAISQLVLAFVGPLALRVQPRLLIPPVYSLGLDEQLYQRFTDFINESMVRTRSYTIVTPGMLDDFLQTRGIELESSNTGLVNIHNYLEFAGDQGMDRILSTTFNENSDGTLRLTANLWDVSLGEVVKRYHLRSDSWDQLVAGVDPSNDEAQPLWEYYATNTQGVGIVDMVILVIFAVQLLVGLWGLRGKSLRWAHEGLLFAGGLAFLFGYIYSLNAAMDYVQRFIAAGGGISLAGDVATEQMRTLARFLPLLLISAVGLFLELRKKKEKLYQIGYQLPWDPKGPPQRPSRLSRFASRHGLVLAFSSALLHVLALPSFLDIYGWGPLAFIALVPLFIAFQGAGFSRRIFYGTVYGAFTHLGINFWQGTYGYVALPFNTILSILQVLVLMTVISTIYQRWPRWTWILVPLTFIAYDWLRGFGYIGYPWGFIGVSQYGFVPFIQIADLGGVYLVSFVLYLFNTALATVAIQGWPRARLGLSVKITSVILSFTLVYGLITYLAYQPGQANRSVLMVQQNTDPRKHSYGDTVNSLLRLSQMGLEEASANGQWPHLLLWPEMTFPYDLSNEPSSTALRQKQRVVDLIKPYGVSLLTGTRSRDKIEGAEREDWPQYNSTTLMAPDGTLDGFYGKINLVPFSEHFPYKEELPWLYDMLDQFNISDWTPGSEYRGFEHLGTVYATPICFEDVFPDHVRRFITDAGTDVIANVSNDYWALTPSEGVQHAVHALFRAVENRRPLVRSTVSGLSIHADRRGVIEVALPFYEPAYAVAQVYVPDQQPTSVYTALGDWFPALATVTVGLALIYGLVLAIVGRRKRNT